MSANDTVMAPFSELNKRLANLVNAKTQAVFGTPAERKIMLAITDAGIEAGQEMIKLIEDGLTYESWISFLQRSHRIDGPLGLFENEQGELAKIIEDYKNIDLRAAYDAFIESGTFTIEVVKGGLNRLVERKKWAEDLWSREDDHAKAEAVLAQVAKETVDASTKPV